MVRRPRITPKRPVYLGCEGESEVAYDQVINNLVRTCELTVYLHVEPLAPAAGDPLTRVERAIQRIKEREKKREKLHLKAVLLDSDQTAHDPHRASQAIQLAKQENIKLIWQEPCHEALLLRHMPGCSDRRPPTSSLAEQALKAKWPEYDKPMSRARLVKRISFDSIQQAAAVEPDLRAFLKDISLLP